MDKNPGAMRACFRCPFGCNSVPLECLPAGRGLVFRCLECARSWHTFGIPLTAQEHAERLLTDYTRSVGYRELVKAAMEINPDAVMTMTAEAEEAGS